MEKEPIKQKIKVMHLCGSKGPSGTEKFFMRLVKAQMENPELEITPVVRKNSWLDGQLKEQKIKHYTAPFKGGLGRFVDFKTIPLLHGIIDAEQPDIVQTWVGSSSRLVPHISAPQIAFVGHDYPSKLYKNADYAVGTTENICEHIRRSGRPETRFEKIPTFVNMPPEGFQGFRCDVRSEYNIPEESTVLLLLGRLHEQKGFDIALFALNMLPDNVYVLLVGTGPDEKALRAAVQADGLSNRVRFVGWVDNTTPFFAAADVFVLPSRFESSSSVILEAWAHRLPVIATETSSLYSLITHDNNGLLIEPDSEQELAQAVERILSEKELLGKLALSGYREVCAEFSRNDVLEKYNNLYKKLVQK